MKVHELITLLSRCPAGCDVEIAAGDMIAEPITEVQLQSDVEDTVFIFAGDPEVMDSENAPICRLSELIARTRHEPAGS